MKNKILILVLFIILLNVNSFAQNRISFTIAGGSGNLREINKTSVQIGNYYSSISSYKAGVYYDFYKNDSVKFFPTLGFFITAKGAKNNLPNGMVWYGTNKTYLVQRFYSFDLPIILNYRFEKWLLIKGGINTSLLFATSNLQKFSEKKLMSFGFFGGGSIKVKRFSVNAEYIYDISDMLKYRQMNVSYRNSLLHIGIGYYF